jgi:ketosteroid isomerase-like protein
VFSTPADPFNLGITDLCDHLRQRREERSACRAGQAWADAFDLWERFESEERGFDVMGDIFVAHLRVRCFPHREGPPVEYDGHYVMELRDGKISYSRPYVDRAEARRDAEARSAQRLRSD